MKTEMNMEEAILESATELFLSKGFASTSTTEIAKRAGCNQALVHYYYRTKDKLFEAIFQHKMKFLLGSLFSTLPGDIPFEDKIRKRIEAHFDALEEDPKLPLFFFSEISQNPLRIEALKAVIGDMPKLALAQIEAELNTEFVKGTIKKTSARDLLMTIVSLNITVFLIEPMFKAITNMTDEEFKKFQHHRKEENIAIVLKSLRKE